jgi:hypothetical protein
MPIIRSTINLLCFIFYKKIMELGQGDSWRSYYLETHSWIPYAPQGVKGSDDDDDDIL